MKWIDSHAHLVSDELYENFEVVLDQALKNDVERILIICDSVLEIERALEKTAQHAMLDLAIGLHPTSVADVSETEFQEMMRYASHPRVVAIGEIGLDYYWDETHKDLQMQRFLDQIAVANQHHLPIIVHTRSSAEAVYTTLIEQPVTAVGVIHCFSETLEYAKKFLDLGFYLGYGGILTFKNGENVREAFEITPRDRILTETDSPYLAPVPLRGKRNQPAYVKHVGEMMITLTKDVKIDAVVKENYQRLFNVIF